jgi:hypothetical protein
MNGLWNNEDKKLLVSVVAPLIEMQKAYGKVMDMKLVLKGWEALLADKYTVNQVIFALKEYALKKDDFPSPANINLILNPKKPKITQAEYIAAQKYQERNNYPQFSQQRDIIKEYEKQEGSAREDVSPIMLEALSVKRIT